MLDRLTLDQLRALIAVAETGSFSAAARKLGRVQSAISQSVQSLETTLGFELFDRSEKTPKLNEPGRAMLQDAYSLVRGADMMRARAEGIANNTEAELSLAVDAMFPSALLMESLRAFSKEFACVPVTLFTEGLGAAEQRLRDGLARLAIYSPLSTAAQDLEWEHLTTIPMVPVCAADHPLANAAPPIDHHTLEQQVQLVLTDRTPVSAHLRGGIVSLRIWRFADLATRLEYLLAGFGWCNMPLHLVEDHIRDGRLKQLVLKDRANIALPMHVAYERGRPPGRAGRWFVEDMRKRLRA
ncbi:MAG TPA: LysR family transcriptional regulator [Rhizomicrobium sp.]|jgi:DNA-binding transcriptional LysR family regulator|nr:LysR family transcriptional regulator [Rhizomicrobium sp.]